MADRYQDRAYSAGGDYDRDSRARASDNAESDPLAELARLIGQTDPFGAKPMSRANLQAQPQARPADPEPSYDDDYADPEPYEAPPPAPPSWMQRAAVRQEAPPPPPPQQQQDYYADEDDYPAEVHPLHRYAAPQPAAQPDYDDAHLFADAHQPQPDTSRYDDALYGSLESDAQNAQHDHGYVDNAYAYEDDQQYDQVEEPRKRGGMITVFAVLALAVFGVGGAYAYRTFTSSARTGEPPIIRADAGPTKIVPAPGDGATKVPDRMAPGDGTEKIVSREETPIDPNRSGPRVVFPPLTANGTAPMPTSVIPPGVSTPAPNGANGTFSNNDPRRIKTFSVRGDQADAGTPAATAPAAAPAAKGAAAQRAAAAPNAHTATNPTAANANVPLSLAPQSDAPAAAEPPVRMAATNPTQAAPSAPASSGGNFLVQISSQKSEADAQASFRALQTKFPSVLGSRAPVIKRADLGDKGVYYRAMVGPFGSPDEASQFCGSLKSAGGQCVVQRN
jgi:hypothetical protein